MHTVKLELDLGEDRDLSSIHGRLDESLRIIEEALNIEASIRGNKVFLQGNRDAIDRARDFITDLQLVNSNGYILNPEDIKYVIKAVEDSRSGEPQAGKKPLNASPSSNLKEFLLSTIPVSSKKKFLEI